MATICPNIGMEKESVIRISFVAFRLTLVTANPDVP